MLAVLKNNKNILLKRSKNTRVGTMKARFKNNNKVRLSPSQMEKAPGSEEQ